MSLEQWSAVDEYFQQLLIGKDPVLSAVLTASEQAGLPSHNVSPTQGKFLSILTKCVNAKKILEIGTLGGYSTIWFARALPTGGKIVTLEVDPKHASVARHNFALGEINDKVDLRVGKALELLPIVASEGIGPFDLVFIDADKQNNEGYFKWAVELSRPGTVIIGDNVVRDGEVIDSESADERVQGTRRLFDIASQDSRVEATAIQTVGCKGYDGFMFARVREVEV